MTRMICSAVIAAAVLSLSASPAEAQLFGNRSTYSPNFGVAGPATHPPVVPGTGQLVHTDDFEAENWGYKRNDPKSSKENDEVVRGPLGYSYNGRWKESGKRGHPDVVKVIATPRGGIAGSGQALLMHSRDTGIPGRPGGEMSQDDFLMSARPMSLGNTPNFTVRVYFPPWEQWEQRHGVTFGIRAGLQGPYEKEEEVTKRRLFRGSYTVKERVKNAREPYYPGFFIQYNPKSSGKYSADHAVILIRARENGSEQPVSKRILKPGWWTFGMSTTPDARCHYYASEGVDELTAADHLYSSLPYGIPGTHFNTIFFNVCSADNGRSWSTPWVIDDPKVYSLRPMSVPKTKTASRSNRTRR